MLSKAGSVGWCQRKKLCPCKRVPNEDWEPHYEWRDLPDANEIDMNWSWCSKRKLRFQLKNKVIHTRKCLLEFIADYSLFNLCYVVRIECEVDLFQIIRGQKPNLRIVNFLALEAVNSCCWPCKSFRTRLEQCKHPLKIQISISYRHHWVQRGLESCLSTLPLQWDVTDNSASEIGTCVLDQPILCLWCESITLLWRGHGAGELRPYWTLCVFVKEPTWKTVALCRSQHLAMIGIIL